MSKKERSEIRAQFNISDLWEELEKASQVTNKKEIDRLRRLFKECLQSLHNIRTSHGYKLIESISYLLQHQQLDYIASHFLSEVSKPAESAYNKYYWEVSEELPNHRSLIAEFNPLEYPTFPGTIELWAGPISQLKREQRALMADMTYMAYAHELIRVEEVAQKFVATNFPELKELRREQAVVKRQRELEAQLLLEMCHSYREDYVVAIASARLHADPKTEYMIGSIGGARGQAGQVFWPEGRESVDYQTESSLATQNLMRYALSPEFDDLRNLSEDQFVEITRLHVVPPGTIKDFDEPVRQKVSQVLMYMIHLAVKRNFPGAIKEVCNTRKALNRGMRQKGLDVRFLAQDGTLRVNPSVLASIFGNYFEHHDSHPQILDIGHSVEIAGRAFFGDD